MPSAIYFARKVQMKIGYARVSTEDQRLTLQLDALKQAGCGKVFREKVSGAYRDRPELNRMLDQLQVPEFPDCIIPTPRHRRREHDRLPRVDHVHRARHQLP